MSINWIYKDDRNVFRNVERGGVPYLSFKALEDTGMVINGFSTRLGGASKGRFATMNFSYSRKDDPADVLENFTRMADALVDPVHYAIGLSHSGWRGTVRRMGQVTMDAMKEAFGTRPEDVTACIGPSICRDCFEVGEEVAEAFADAFDPKYRDALYRANAKPGKYQLDLWKANEIIFQEAGVPKEQIHTTNICTMCNSDYLFSHRRVGEERGNLAAFLSIR